jgi:ABC-2 type transport system permease protein
MRAMIVKEFRQLRRDRRTLAMMILMPILLLVILGYAASFDVSTVPTVVAGPQAATVAGALPKPFQLAGSYPAASASAASAWAHDELRDGHAAVAIVTGTPAPVVLIDGSQLFTAQAAERALATLRGGTAGAAGGVAADGVAADGVAADGVAAGGVSGSGSRVPAVLAAAGVAGASVQVLYNPQLKTSDIMVPGLAGVILVFVGTVITSLGVVRERQAGTLEQLAVMPLRPADVFLGKIVPYFAVAVADLAIVLAIGVAVFGVPFRGSAAIFGLGALLFVFVTLGLGVLISSVSQTQGQAIQLAVMTLLPQVLLSGLIFPLSSIVAGVRWIAYLLPLTYFTEIARGVMLRAEPIGSLWPPFVYLALLGVAVATLATLRFRATLAPGSAR